VSFHFGLPHPQLLEVVRRWGGKIMASATTVAEARWLEAHGADAIIAQGLEAGGHRGHFLSPDVTLHTSTFDLLPQVVRAVKVPVIAAGGIAAASEVAAALELGASAVQIGTTYLLCPEATTSLLHRNALTSTRPTALTNLFTGRPARGIVNRLMQELGALHSLAPEFPLAGAALAPLRGKAESQGLDDFTPLWSGQNRTGCRAVPAAQLTHDLAAEL
jgi:nitronate monooxygenase